MTELYASPPSLFSKNKRPFDDSYNYDGPFNHNSASQQPHPNAQHEHQPMDVFSHKRPRFMHDSMTRMDAENRNPSLPLAFAPPPSSSSSSSPSSSSSSLFGRSSTLFTSDAQPAKRLRGADFSEHHAGSNGIGNGMGSGSALAAMQVAFHRTITEKDAEIDALRELAQQLQGQCAKAHVDNQNVEEENRILKRAVTIHDSRQKELLRQNQGLQEVLGKAAEHIAGLEEQNLQLRMEMHLLSANKPFTGRGFDDEYRPPDVY